MKFIKLTPYPKQDGFVYVKIDGIVALQDKSMKRPASWEWDYYTSISTTANNVYVMETPEQIQSLINHIQ